MYGEVLAREYSNALYAKNHRLTVDAYAVQHPGQPSRQTIRSVGLHLASLCAVFEHDIPPHQATAFLQRLARRKDFAWLEPPDSVGEITVVHVHGASGPQEHARRVEEWAQSAWQAWAVHHGTVRGWVEGSL